MQRRKSAPSSQLIDVGARVCRLQDRIASWKQGL